MNNTVILRSGAIGDLLQITPAIREYRRLFPNDKLTLICGESCKNALKKSPHIDKILAFDDRKIYHGTLKERFTESLEILRLLKQFDKCFILHDDLRWTLLTALAGTKDVYSIKKTSQLIPRADRYMKCLCGTNCNSYPYDFYPDTIITPQCNGKYIAIAAGGASNIKNNDNCRRWEGFKELVSYILNETLYSIILLGNKEDTLSIPNARIIDLCGLTTLSEAYNAIENAKAFIGNDSGLLHLAACTETLKIGIFTATSPEKVFGKNTDIICFQSDLSCAPCESRGDFRQDCNAECKDSISPELVFKTLNQLLKQE